MITFFVPSIRPVPTGGNIFNQEIITYLMKTGGLESDLDVVESDRIRLPTAASPDETMRVAVVDSLVARATGSAVTQKAREAFSSMVMIVHYLHLLNPAHNGSGNVQSEREMLKAYDGFVTTSQYSRKALVSHGVPPESVAVLRPGLRDIFRGPLKGISHSPPIRILTVSNVVPGKGLMGLVDVLQAMESLPWRWDVVGTGSLDEDHAARFRNRLSESPLSFRVHLHGSLSDRELLQIYDNSHLFVLPSRFESCSMVLMEAMARGLPAVAFEVGGIPETVMGSQGVWLIPSGDWDAFGEALRELVNHRSRRVTVGREGWKTSKDFPSWNSAGREFYEAIMLRQAQHDRDSWRIDDNHR